jgi:hypothetical protein
VRGLRVSLSREKNQLMREALIEKFRLDRFSTMFGKMAAIVGYILR